MAIAFLSRAVKWNVDPRPSLLSSQIRPGIISIKRIEMLSPRPVPPYLRVVEVSAWLNGSKIIFCLSGEIPTPVSRQRCRPYEALNP